VLKYENQIVAIEKQKETRDMLEGSAREQPTSLIKRFKCKFKIRKWVQLKKESTPL
jgi:hypothetical protein